MRVELKGPDNSVRVRHVRLLGRIEGESLKIGKQHSSLTIQQKNCETETLRVFRLITAQVFGKLIQGEQDGHTLTTDSGSVSASESLEPLEESNDLREHMVGILFSRSKLTHLQKQVCVYLSKIDLSQVQKMQNLQVIVHIVQAIRKEAIRVKDEWELLLCSGTTTSSHSGNSQDATKNSDTYCFEMLSMVLALSGSSVGRSYLSHQSGLLGDLLTLLHTGSARVQRQVFFQLPTTNYNLTTFYYQVTSLLRRILPEINPDSFAKVMGVDRLPPKDFSVVSAAPKDLSGEFNVHRAGILDIFLSIIAKALSVQVKVKVKTGSPGAPKEINTVTLATSIHPRDNIKHRWWLRGCVSRKLAEVIVHLIKDMAAVSLCFLLMHIYRVSQN